MADGNQCARPPLIELMQPAQRLMQRTIAHHGLTARTEALFSADPFLAEATQRLAAYLPAAITRPYSRDTLYATALRAAVTAKADESDCISCLYLTELIRQAAPVLRYNLVDREGKRWDPLNDPPLMVWFRLNPPAQHQRMSAGAEPWRPLPLARFATGLFRRLIPDGVLVLPPQLAELS